MRWVVGASRCRRAGARARGSCNSQPVEISLRAPRPFRLRAVAAQPVKGALSQLQGEELRARPPSLHRLAGFPAASASLAPSASRSSSSSHAPAPCHHGPLQAPLARRKGQQARALAAPALSTLPPSPLGRRRPLDLVLLARRARQAHRGRPPCARKIRHDPAGGRLGLDGAHVGDRAGAGVGERGQDGCAVRRGAPPISHILLRIIDLPDEN